MIGISVISLVILLGVLIFAHEFGHFIVAKRAGVGVLKFSLGFGRKLFGWRRGETEYMVSVIPLGGYVKLLGESETEELSEGDRKRSFSAQSVWKRILIVAAGPIFNILLAILIFFFVYMAGVPSLTARIGDIQSGSPAGKGGIKAGDEVVTIDGMKISYWEDLAKSISESKGQPMRIAVMRDGHMEEFTIVPSIMKGKNIFGEEVSGYKMGISPAGKTVVRRLNPAAAFWGGLRQTWFITKLTYVGIVKMIEGVISPKTLGGPILIAQIAGAEAKEGLIPFFLFMALLSINLAVLNLLPIPVLDGGHLLFFMIEAIKGSEVSLTWRERAQQVGFMLIVLLMIWVLLMDVERLNLKIVNDFTRIFTGK
ncbi:MAG: RIP metalloprotease RseP [Syntrophales bacterium]